MSADDSKRKGFTGPKAGGSPFAGRRKPAAGRPRPPRGDRSADAKPTYEQGTNPAETQIPRANTSSPSPGKGKPASAEENLSVWEQARLAASRPSSSKGSSSAARTTGKSPRKKVPASVSMSEEELAVEAARLRAAMHSTGRSPRVTRPQGEAKTRAKRVKKATPKATRPVVEEPRTRKSSSRPTSQKNLNSGEKRPIYAFLMPPRPLRELPAWEAAAWVILYVVFVIGILGAMILPFVIGGETKAAEGSSPESRSTSEVPYNVYRCTAADLKAAVDSSTRTLDFGSPISFTIKLTNTTKFACNLESDAKAMGVQVTSGEDTYFSSVACPSKDPQPKSILIPPGKTYERKITWDAKRYNSNCEAGDPVSPGTYRASLVLEKLPLEEKTVFLVK
ncbi:hypothetical protein KRX54_00780 [Actinomycetaceae bacterium TAE3-ERU4]|nr:hypothetical protein [Actinomycetaceae bacterium TAE3-ERU4]